MTSLLDFEDVTKSYELAGQRSRDVLRSVTLSLSRGESVALVGRSGSGKSTLLHLAAGVDVATSGRVRLAGRDLARLTEADRTLLRRKYIGLVFQFFHLLPHLTVADNVALPGWIAGTEGSALASRVEELLRRVDLWDRRSDHAGRLSGGEMQRVAICRALLHRPALILADEPTGSLDDAGGRVVMSLLHEMTRQEGGTLLFVTHSLELARQADRIWRLQSGVLTTADGLPERSADGDGTAPDTRADQGRERGDRAGGEPA